jgi:hypothetical protein
MATIRIVNASSLMNHIVYSKVGTPVPEFKVALTIRPGTGRRLENLARRTLVGTEQLTARIGCLFSVNSFLNASIYLLL